MTSEKERAIAMIGTQLKNKKAEPFELSRLGEEKWTEKVMDSYYRKKWTRVKNGTHLESNLIRTYDLLEDIVADQTSKSEIEKKKSQRGKILFSIPDYRTDVEKNTVANQTLPDLKLRRYAKTATKIIEEFEKRAAKLRSS